MLKLIQDLGYLYPTAQSKEKKRYGLYECICGASIKLRSAHVKNGHTKSCGCLKIEKSTTHGLSNHRLYGTWAGMHNRCYRDDNINYNIYGGRGIMVCERWHDVTNFIGDMCPSYKEGLTLDRIDSSGNYEPSNCRWATKSTQSQNTILLYSSNTSGYRGVTFNKREKKFKAKIVVDSKAYHLGYFSDPISAAKAYDSYVIQHNLEHTRNF